jgi:hypothetical protein
MDSEKDQYADDSEELCLPSFSVADGRRFRNRDDAGYTRFELLVVKGICGPGGSTRTHRIGTGPISKRRRISWSRGDVLDQYDYPVSNGECKV